MQSTLLKNTKINKKETKKKNILRKKDYLLFSLPNNVTSYLFIYSLFSCYHAFFPHKQTMFFVINCIFKFLNKFIYYLYYIYFLLLQTIFVLSKNNRNN